MIEPKLYMNALLMGCLLQRWYFDVDRISKMTPLSDLVMNKVPDETMNISFIFLRNFE